MSVIAADTWLHISTKTVPFVNTTSVTSAEKPKFSLRFNENCTDATNPGGNNDAACGINVSRFGNYLVKSRQAFEVINNVSTMATVSTYDEEVPYVYLGPSLSPDDANMDYRATTYGLQTTCRTRTKDCNMTNPVQASTPFTCNDVFKGNPGFGIRGNSTEFDQSREASFQYWSFVNSDLTELADESMGYQGKATNSMINPFYTGLTARSLYGVVSADNDYLLSDQRGGTSFVLACETTSYDISYDWVNGAVEKLNAQPSNTTVGMFASTIMGSTFDITAPHGLYLQNAIINAIISSNSSEGFAGSIALAYSKATLAMFSEMVVPEHVSQFLHSRSWQ